MGLWILSSATGWPAHMAENLCIHKCANWLSLLYSSAKYLSMSICKTSTPPVSWQVPWPGNQKPTRPRSHGRVSRSIYLSPHCQSSFWG
ncbi:uncharacterized protein BO72DRAFT_131664 [Aspergillus fijiensis CBS 313.89]|uniref:Uncharacterized protein n=1 Tax=Aspergillus fijiensis CBS 313.89 TaxID=1448319 RepID=A0A8G1RTQ7_9EURO|nr:uncharacterized protein BO72DRAFT_131664 [Aspergillus fijiensis CBS 313.89]RAK76596.1 hypothetical protein BO72DRAFT_131664 [Aspergillus fijiensis CBS 313.89]